MNGAKRALTSARRMIGLVVAVGYYVLVFMRPFDRSPGGVERELGLSGGQLALPPMEVLHGVVFAIFAALSFILALGTFSPRATFRPADVDVLFATPVSPKVVLVFRIVRDYLVTLLFPLLLILLTWRPMSTGLSALFSNLPGSEGYVYRSWSLAWLLMSLCWVSIGYAASLFVNRSDLTSDRNRLRITIASVVLALGIAAYITFRLRLAVDWPSRLELVNDPVLRVVFFTGTFATMMVMGPLRGELWMTGVGALSLVVITLAALRVAMTQVGWLYDQAAARGFDSLKTRRLQSQGDMIGVLAEQARQGKLRAGRRGWLKRIRVQGAAAILWREVAQQSRAMWGMIALLVLMGVTMSLLPVLASSDDASEAIGFVFMSMQALSVFIVTMSVAQGGFIDLLRRVDLQKPLPFTATATSFYEIVAKALPGVLASWLAALVVLALKPILWAFVVAAAILMPAVSILFSAALFVVIVLFPDVEDPTQRAFRGLMTILTLAILTGPVLVAFAGVSFVSGGLQVGPILASLVATGVALALALVAASVGGSLYASYNPSE